MYPPTTTETTESVRSFNAVSDNDQISRRVVARDVRCQIAPSAEHEGITHVHTVSLQVASNLIFFFLDTMQSNSLEQKLLSATPPPLNRASYQVSRPPFSNRPQAKANICLLIRSRMSEEQRPVTFAIFLSQSRQNPLRT